MSYNPDIVSQAIKQAWRNCVEKDFNAFIDRLKDKVKPLLLAIPDSIVVDKQTLTFELVVIKPRQIWIRDITLSITLHEIEDMMSRKPTKDALEQMSKIVGQIVFKGPFDG